jgi:hyperosmotically inducible periplasmic protein
MVALVVTMTQREPSRFTKTALAFVLCALPVVSVSAQAPETQVQPDNTKVNKQDRDEKRVTADQQKMNPTDRELTQRIRKSIMADKALSTYAHNVKIISQNGTVTLKGPVRSDEEVKTIVAKATEVAGDGEKVVNQLTVKP